MSKARSRQNYLETILHRLKKISLRLERSQAIIPRLRLASFLTWLFLAVLAYNYWSLAMTGTITGMFLVVFNLVAMKGRKLDRFAAQLRALTRVKKQHLARLQRDFKNIDSVNYRPQPDHPYAHDLDITGPASLLQLISTCTANSSITKLAELLLQPQHSKAVLEYRSGLIAELSRLAAFRDKTTSLVKQFRSAVLDAEKLKDWLNQLPVKRAPLYKPLVALSVSVANLAMAWLFFNSLLPVGYVLCSLTLHFLFYFLFAKGQATFLREISFLSTELTKMKRLFYFLETARFKSKPSLSQLLAPFHTEPGPRHLYRQMYLVDTMIGLRMNLVLGFILNMLLPWDIFIIYFFDRLKAQLKKSIPLYIETLAEFEAYSSLANFRFLNSSYCFASFNETGPGLQAKDLTHCLLPSAVANDFQFANQGGQAIVTGSNMSGKSTFLRTIGINLVLAYAGSVVAASYFSTRFFNLYTCIRIEDSLDQGLSYFYAEVKRLKAMLESFRQSKEAGFFLIDEIFRGTNNRERLLGSREYIRELVRLGSSGLVATHDLELAALADEFEQIENYHFKETIEEGTMLFDYTILSGPCPSTNALRILAFEGLPVPTGQAG